MSENTGGSVHWSFWLITGITLIWNAAGVLNFVMQMDPAMIASYREAEQAIITDRPAWATLGFAVAVFSGTLGCLLLLLRKSVAFYFFVASLLGVLLTTVHTVGVDADFSGGEIIGIVVMPVAVAAALVWYARFAEGKGWIR